MSPVKRSQGFTLVELLLVLAIIGIISVIAIPHFMGQRRRARVIGDATANAQVLRMLLETRKADTGGYGPASGHYTWTNGVASDPTFLPGFTPQGNSQMNYDILIGPTPLTYVVTCTDPTLGPGVVAFQVDSQGQVLQRLH